MIIWTQREISNDTTKFSAAPSSDCRLSCKWMSEKRPKILRKTNKNLFRSNENMNTISSTLLYATSHSLTLSFNLINSRFILNCIISRYLRRAAVASMFFALFKSYSGLINNFFTLHWLSMFTCCEISFHV